MRDAARDATNGAARAAARGAPRDAADEAGAEVAPDLESRMHDGDHQALRVWLRLLACTTRIEDQIRQRLRNDFGTTLPRFDLLAQLERSPDGLTT